MATSSTSNNGRQRSASRTLPTRKSKAAAAAPAVAPKEEAADEARHHESPGTDAADDGERTPSSPGDATKDGPAELQPAFNLRDMATIDSLPNPHRHPPATTRRRSPSPSKGTVVSRRGRSRSPVGLAPRPASRPRSRSASRAGSAGRPGSRPGSRAGSAGRASAATVPTSGGMRGKELSGAALAAGEAAAGVVAVEHRFAGAGPYPGANGFAGLPPAPPRGRSPSPVARFPDGSMSFEISPQQSMSFVQPGSFDWNVGPAVGGGLPPSPPPGGHHWHPSYEPHGGHGGAPGYHGGAQGHGRRSPSPSRYPPADCHRGDPYHEPREQPHYDPRYAPAYSSYQGGHRDPYQGGHRDPYREHPRGRSPSPLPGDLPRRNSQQALFPEHHVRGYDHSSGRNGHPVRSRNASAGSRRSRSPAQAPGRSSVFRGSPTTPGKDNLPRELLLALEEEDDDATPPSSPAKTNRKGSQGAKKKGSQCATAKKGATKQTKPRKAAKRKSLGRESSAATANHSLGNPSMLDPAQLDAVLNDAMLAGDYLDANLSFRKSYDLEQVFSFVKEGPHGASGMPMTLGSMSFNLGFSESRSNEEGDEKKMVKALRSQSNLGLTPINSFSDGTKVAPAASIDGGMLRAFFSSSPPNAIEGLPPSDDRAPVVHANTPPSYGGGPAYQQRGMGPHYNAGTPPRAPHSRPPYQPNVGFPRKRIKLSTRHTLHPTSADLSARAGRGDFFSLLRKMAPAFGGFRFKLPEMEDAVAGGLNGLPVVSHDSPPGPADGRPAGGRLGGKPSAGQMAMARRRVASSVCAFGGALPPRTVSPSLGAAEAKIGSVTRAADVGKAITQEERALALKEEEEERARYEEELPGRYLLKEHGLSWDVELHETIAPKVVPGAKGKTTTAGGGNAAAVTATPKAKAKAIRPPPSVGKFCAPVTPHTPPSHNAKSPKSPGTPAATTPGGREKGTKIKYRCKHCGQPKQGHACPYGKGLVRSIGTMVYPAVNAFVSHEPGRLAPALSEMNNFTSLLSQDTRDGSHASGSHPPRMPGGPYRPYRVLTPDTSHWSPNTPGGLSTMSSSGDHRSPGSVGGGHGARPFPGRSLTRTMSMAPAPAGAIPSDALFRDTVVLEPAQFRTVRAVSATVAPSAASTVTATTAPSSPGAAAPNPTESPRAYRYPAIPTPYAQRKEMGDALFALSREVPRLADACAAILRDARETDAWDQAVAELTTQVLVVVKCDKGDYGLEGLRRHLVTLGIAC